MDVGGQAADQVVRSGIQLTEESIKLLAAGSKNLAAFLLALAQDNKKVMGKTSMGRILREGKDVKVFQVKETDWNDFVKHAKQYGILYAGVKSKDSGSGVIDVVSNVGYLSQINRVMELMNYPIPTKQEETAAKKAAPHAQQGKCSPERGSGSTPSTRTPTSDKPSVKGRLAALEAASRGIKQPPQREQIKTR